MNISIEFANINYGSRAEELVTHLDRRTREGVDVFCFQEIDPVTMDVCDTTLEGYQRTCVGKNYQVHDPDKGLVRNNMYVATYYRPNICMLRSRQLLPKREMGVGLFTQFDIKGRTLNLVNVHGVPYPGDKTDNENRLEQSQILIDAMNEQPEGAVIGGDFNLGLHAWSAGMFRGWQYRDLIDEYQVPATRNQDIWNRYPRPQAHADRTFTRGVEVRNFRVPTCKEEWISDHQPQYLTIDL